ncbi:MAG: APC family permease [Candidatus Omnitrophica bacterium]|nr:APC family permease [Candidatus Omnitrophota bacterium]
MNGEQENKSILKKIKTLLFGKAHSHSDPLIFHKLSLVVFFAWVGLGSDGLTSSCYGPEEAFLALGHHIYLGIFVALATAVTIFIISSSYSQIIELFPSGGGGYLVASKLLSPTVGMISGCALLIDYVLTIALSISSGTDALFSFLPGPLHAYKLVFALGGVLLLTMLNLRGVKESVLPLVPIFLTFLITHLVIIVYVLATHFSDFSGVVSSTVTDVRTAQLELGTFGMFLLIMRAYSMGAGTYTGIEAVSNGLPILREPKVETAKKTMRYMSISLAVLVLGLMLGYLLFKVQHQPGKTLNAILFENVVSGWGKPGYILLLITLISEAVLLFVAAQTGFLDGPRVLSNMAKDRWFPSQFALLSERFVTQNGILMMGLAAVFLVFFSRGSVKFLVVLYSINVFITFFLSQLGMVRHWWKFRDTAKGWVKKLFINGVGLVLTAFILLSVSIIKFHEGGWITIFITGLLVMVAILIRRHYRNTLLLLKRLDTLKVSAELSLNQGIQPAPLKPDLRAKTAVIMVSGYNGLGLHTLFNVLRLFKDNFKNILFVEAGVIDSGNFKGSEELNRLKEHVEEDLARYVNFVKAQGFYSESFYGIGIDKIDELCDIAADIVEIYPNAVFFGGQLVFPKETFLTRLLHNQTTFAVQRQLYQQGVPFLIMPIRVE